MTPEARALFVRFLAELALESAVEALATPVDHAGAVGRDAELLDTAELARRLSPTSPRTIERWRTTGQGPAFLKIGRRVFYRASAVDAWLDQQTRTHTHGVVAVR